MNVRNVFGCVLVLALLFLPGFVGCQPLGSNSVTKEDFKGLADSVTKLADEMHAALKDSVTQKDLEAVQKRLAVTENAVRDNAAALELAKARLDKAASLASIAGVEDRLVKVERDLALNVDVTGQQRVELGKVVKKDAVGNSIISILEQTRQSSQFRDDLRQAVREVSPQPMPAPAIQQPWGTMRIENRMPTLQNIEVNGTSYWVEPLRILDVSVPAGWATTQLTGYELMKSWWLGAPNFFQIVIIDRQPL